MLQEIPADSEFIPNPYLLDTPQPLPQLPHPVYFVSKNPKWQDLFDNSELPTDPEAIEALYERCVKTNDIWSVQAYLDLKLRGLDVHLVPEPIPGKICVIPHYFCKPKDWLYRTYVVACHHDCPHSELCNQQIVINQLRVFDKTHHFLPHRPQPNLRPRELSRGERVENMVFKGHGHSLFAPFQTPEFLAELQDIGVKLVVNSESGRSTFADWANYTEADVVLAVRNNTLHDISLKPALKLINAWFAGCPAILGPEPAYQAIRQSELDYFEVRSPQEAIAALKRLKSEPGLYTAMVQNGFKRAQEYTVSNIALKWRDLLAGPIAEDYEKWLSASPLRKTVGRPIKYAWQLVKYKASDMKYRRAIHHGKRIL